MFIYLSMIDSPNEKSKFEQLYLQYRHLMLHVATEILHNHHDAEDAVHQAFIAIIKNMDKISDVGSPKTRSYIVIITERKAIDLLRYNQRHSTIELNEDIVGIQFSVPKENVLAYAMTKLPAHYRQVLLLRYDNGFSSKEIANMLDITESGVRKLLTRAKKALHAQLQKEADVL